MRSAPVQIWTPTIAPARGRLEADGLELDGHTLSVVWCGPPDDASGRRLLDALAMDR